MAGSLGLLHLSDIHCDSSGTRNIERAFRSIAEQLRDEDQPVDIVAISGDIAKSGQASEYECFRPLLEEFLTAVADTRPALFITPGNHDVDWSAIDRFEEAGLESIIVNAKEADEIWTERPELALRRFSAYNNFLDQLGEVNGGPFEFEGNRVGVAVLNSAWRSSAGNDKGKLFLSQEQLLREFDKIRDCEFRVALVHHPISWLHESEQNDVHTFYVDRFHVVCSGHRHESQTVTMVAPGGQVFHSCARALHTSDGNVGFCHVAVDFENNHLTANVRKWEVRRKRFVPDTEIADDGKFSGSLAASTGGQIEARKDREFLARSRQKAAAAITKHSESIAPELYKVLPRDALLPQLEGWTAGEGIVSFERVAASTSSWLFVGDAQCGKSVVLGHLCEFFGRRGNAAILLEFNDIPREVVRKGRVTEQIASVLQIQSSAARRVIGRGLTILVDHLDLSDADRMATLASWEAEHGPLRFIGTTRASQLKLAASAEQQLGKSWNKVRIRPLALSQIRRALKMLHDSGATGIDNTIVSFVDQAFELELPRFPWLVSMHLDLCLRGITLKSESIRELFRAYTSLRLADLHQENVAGVQFIETLRRLAAAMYASARCELSQEEAETIAAASQKRVGIDIAGSKILSSLESAGFVVQSRNTVTFTLAALVDYFYVDNLVFRHIGMVADRLDGNEVRRLSGALPFYVETQEADDVARKIFDIALANRPHPSSTMDLDYLLKVEGIPVEMASELLDTFEKREDELREEIDRRDATSQQKLGDKRRKQIETQVSPESFELFIDTLAAGVSSLRSGGCLSQEAKLHCVNRAVDCTASLINHMLTEASVNPDFLGGPVDPTVRDKQAGFLTSLLVIIGNSIVARVGAASHLGDILQQALAEEEDWGRRTLLLTWYSALGQHDITKVLDDNLNKHPPPHVLHILQQWFLAVYLGNTLLEGRKDTRSRSCLEHVTRVLSSTQARGPARKANANENTQRVMRHADETVRLFQRTEPDKAVESE